MTMDDQPTPEPAPHYPPPVAGGVEMRSPKREPGTFKRGFGMGAGLGLGLAITFVALAIIGGIVAVASTAAAVASVTSAGASTALGTLWGEPGAEGKLRAISVTGPIMTDPSEGGLLVVGSFGYEIAEQFDALEEDDADGVVLLVNTPGGSITGSKAIADGIERYQERTGKTVLVHVEGMSASGGVYSTAPADAIYADHGSLVGSIGVIFGPFQRFNDVVATSGNLFESGVTTTGGITEEYLTKGTGKDFGNPFRDMTDQERQMFDTMLETEYTNFVDHVAQNRDIEATTIRDELGAFIFSNDEAQEVGLIDGTLNREEFFTKAATEAGLEPEDTVVEVVEGPTGLEALLGASRAMGTSLPIAELGEGYQVSTGFCGGQTPLVFTGKLSAVCG